MHRKTNHIAILGLLSVTFLLSSFSISSVSAASATITTNNSITLNTSSAGNGVTIDEESIGITTTCDKGYDLTIATSTSTNLYLNGDSTKTAAYTAVDGTSALNSSNNTNKWGYTTTSEATSSTVFSPLSTTASTIRTISQTNNLTSETIPIYYGIKTDNTVDPGTYSMGNNGVITYYLTMNPLCNVVDISYDGNNADAGTMGAAGTGVIHTGVKDGDTIDLIASNFSRDGYGFAGWSLDPDAGTKLLDNDNTNNPVVYGPQETVTLPEGFIDNDTDNDGIVKLYAVWLQSQGSLQGWMGCNNLDTATYDQTTGALDLTKNSVTALTDQRDHDTYAVARLADGKCWMIENLRLDNDAAHNSDGTLTQGYGTSTTYGNFGGLADVESDNFLSSTTANSLYYSGTQSGDATIDIGTTNYPDYRMPRYNNLNTPANANDRPQNPTSNSFADNNTTAGMYSYGNYYTWHAAIADLTYNGTNNQSTTNTSLCPAGWHLPTGGAAYASGNTSGVNVTGDTSTFREFYNLGYKTMDETKTAYEDTPSSGQSYYSSNTTNTAGKTATAALRSFPNNFLYSGFFLGSSAYLRGSFGYYWSSAARDNYSSYYLSLGSSSVKPGTDSGSKYSGGSIRCTASDPVTYTLSYDTNGGTGAPSSPEPIYANGSATFTLSNTTPTRSGYTFVGWTDEKGNAFQPGTTLTTKEVSTNLYAIWTNNSCNPTATTIGTGNTATDAVCLQDVKPSMKASLPIATATTGTHNLIDARDGQSYTIAKLSDGELWMTKNLNYNSTVMNTPHDTDVSSSTFRLPQSTTTSNTDNNAATIRTTNNSGNNDNGTYYSWPAAIASTESYTTGNVASSICPKGWDLPISDQYSTLSSKSSYSSSNRTDSSPSSFLINGGFTDGTTFYQTSYSFFWTSTVSSSTAAYGARVNGTTMTTSSSTGSTYGGNKYYRKNIRCVASSGTVNINYESNGTTEYPVTGFVASQIDAGISTTRTQPGTGFTRSEWLFIGWNTSADGTGTPIAANTYINTINPTPGSTITLYAQWKHNYSIQYDGNGAENADGMGTLDSATGVKSIRQINLAEGDPVTLLPSNFKKPNNSFVGWSTDPDAWTHFTDNDNTNDPVIYGPVESISAPAYPTNGTNILTMYAVWVPAKKDGNDNPVYLQEWDNPNDSTDGCATLTATTFDSATGTITTTKNSIVALTDKRDDEVYAIAKLADGNCWMIENLRLEHEGTVGNNKNDKTITNQSLSQGYGGVTGTYGNFVGLGSSDSVFNGNTTSDSIYKSSANPPVDTYDPATGKLEDIGTSDSPGYRFPRYNSESIHNLVDGAISTEDYTDASNPVYSGWNQDENRINYRFATNLYSYGNYYNWPAAMANTRNNPAESVGTSICPYGWHLPSTYGTNKEFAKLSQLYGGEQSNQSNGSAAVSSRFRTFPNNFVYSGYRSGSTSQYTGENGHYWSRSSYTNTSAYRLNMSPTFIYASLSFNKYYGLSVRCLVSGT